MARSDGLSRRRIALTYLEEHTVMTLATHGRQGVWAAAVFYANAGFDLYFLSAGHTRHGQDLKLNRRAAATIQENYHDWPAIKGIQLAGEVRLLAGEERDRALALYRKKYTFLQNAGGVLLTELARINWYCLSPDLLYFIDNSQGFGHRDEIDLTAGS